MAGNANFFGTPTPFTGAPSRTRTAPSQPSANLNKQQFAISSSRISGPVPVGGPASAYTPGMRPVGATSFPVQVSGPKSNPVNSGTAFPAGKRVVSPKGAQTINAAGRQRRSIDPKKVQKVASTITKQGRFAGNNEKALRAATGT